MDRIFRKLELVSPWTHMAGTWIKFEGSYYYFPTIHNFCRVRVRTKNSSHWDENQRICADDIPKLMKVWSYFDEGGGSDIIDLKACHDGWNYQFKKHGPEFQMMTKAEYFSIAIKIYTLYTKQLILRENCLVGIKDFEDELNNMLPTKCEILVTKGNTLPGLEMIGNNIYLLYSIKAGVRLETSTRFRFEDCSGASVIIRESEHKKSPMTDKTNKYVIVPRGSILEVIKAAGESVVPKGLSLQFGSIPSNLRWVESDRRVYLSASPGIRQAQAASDLQFGNLRPEDL